jgi:hypothetical protein
MSAKMQCRSAAWERPRAAKPPETISICIISREIEDWEIRTAPVADVERRSANQSSDHPLEIEQKYVDLIVRRWQEFTGRPTKPPEQVYRTRLNSLPASLSSEIFPLLAVSRSGEPLLRFSGQQREIDRR